MTGSLRPIKSETDPSLSRWYKEHSLIYVSPDHACWSDEESARKVRKHRFGQVIMADIRVGKGEVDGGAVGRMLKRHEGDSIKFIQNSVKEWETDNADEDETDDEVPEQGADTVMNDVVSSTGLDIPRSARVPIGT